MSKGVFVNPLYDSNDNYGKDVLTLLSSYFYKKGTVAEPEVNENDVDAVGASNEDDVDAVSDVKDVNENVVDAASTCKKPTLGSEIYFLLTSYFFGNEKSRTATKKEFTDQDFINDCKKGMSMKQLMNKYNYNIYRLVDKLSLLEK
jgi:hypothetical protein